MNKLSTCLILITLLLLTGTVSASEKKIKTDNNPVFKLENYQKVIGPFPEGKPVLYSFKIKNTGTAPLKLTNFRSWKGSRILKTPDVIAPGNTGSIDLSFTTLGAGNKALRGVTVVTNENRKNRTHRIGLNMLIKEQIEAVPERIYIDGVEGEDLPEKLNIKGNLETPLKLTLEKAEPEKSFSYKISRDEKTGTYNLHVTNNNKKSGSYRGRIVFKTNYPDKPYFIIPVFSRVLAKVDATPKKIDFGTIDKKSYLTGPDNSKDKTPPPVQQIFVRMNGKASLKIVDVFVENSKECFSISTYTIEKDKIYRIDVTADIKKLPANTLDTFLVIRTDQTDYQLIKVPLKINTK